MTDHAKSISSVLAQFSIDATVTGKTVGPSIVRYEITLGRGVVLKGTDQMDYSNYEPRCRSCHCKYDKIVVHVNNPPRGENHGKCFLTDNEIKDIRDKYSTGRFSQQKLADEYLVSRQHIGKILRGQRRR